MKYVERFLRWIFWVTATAAIAWIFKRAFEGAARRPMRNSDTAQPGEQLREAKELFRDPVCGTYVAGDVAYLLMQGGESLHFCSRDCMEHYRASYGLAAGA
jgi:YHS domain-containing protein